MSVEFVNIYIEKLLNEVVELTKTRILLQTQISILEKTNKELEENLKKAMENKKIRTSSKKEDDF